MSDSILNQQRILLIPGIGGHPSFHGGLVSGLRRTYSVRSATHLDFYREPCADWLAHVDHWAREFAAFRNETSGDRPPVIVGISFGAHVANALRLRAGPEPPGRTVLISYWQISGLERLLLRALRRTSSIGRPLIGAASFRWSELHAPNRAALRALRSEIYDDPALVPGRIYARLSALADAPSRPAPGAVFVFGERELARYRSWIGLRRPARRTYTVPGGHEVSLLDGERLGDVVREALIDNLSEHPGR